MYNYDKKELLEFFYKYIYDYNFEELEDSRHFLGMGISRCAFYFPEEYSDIVFKLGIGDDGDVGEGWYAFEQEEENYQLALENNFARYFAPIEYLGTVRLCNIDEDIQLFIQPRVVETFGESKNSRKGAFKKEHKILSSLYNSGSVSGSVSLSDKVSACFIRKYGIEEFFTLSHFISCVCRLDDLHCQNWGILESGDMIIIDYAM